MKGITQAVEFIAANKDKMPIPAATSNAVAVKSTNSKSVTSILVQNADFAKMKPLVEFLGTKGTVLEKSLTSGKGTIKFEHSGSLDDLVTAIDSKLGSKSSISDFGNNKITMAAR